MQIETETVDKTYQVKSIIAHKTIHTIKTLIVKSKYFNEFIHSLFKKDYVTIHHA